MEDSRGRLSSTVGLVDVPCCDLNLTLRVQSRSADLPEIGIPNHVTRLVVLRPVEDVEALDPQLDRAVTRHRKRLEQRRIDRAGRRTGYRIARLGALRASRGFECGCVEPLIRVLWAVVRIAHLIGALAALVIDRERCAGLQSDDGIDIPAADAVG